MLRGPERGGADQYAAPDGDNPFALTERSEMVQRIREALPRMQKRDATILSLYYNEEFTYAEIGSLLGVSESRICQLHSRALVRLRAEIDNPSERV